MYILLRSRIKIVLVSLDDSKPLSAICFREFQCRVILSKQSNITNSIQFSIRRIQKIKMIWSLLDKILKDYFSGRHWKIISTRLRSIKGGSESERKRVGERRREIFYYLRISLL